MTLVDEELSRNWTDRLGSFGKKQQKKLLSGIGSYASVYELNEQLVASSVDGVGTKLLWALDLDSHYDSIAQDLIAMNVNDLLCVGARPQLFFDYIACGNKNDLNPGQRLDVFIKAVFDICQKESLILAGGETAQMADLYPQGHFDLAGMAIGFMPHSEWLDPKLIDPTKKYEIWGLKSSGPHSNGFTRLRSLFNVKNDRNFIDQNLMAPTCIYTKKVFELKDTLKNKADIKAMFHNTGSGLDNLLRINSVLDESIGFEIKHWPDQGPWIYELKKRSELSDLELFREFNMGIGFMLMIESSDQNKQVLEKQQWTLLGETTKQAQTIKTPWFEYKL